MLTLNEYLGKASNRLPDEAARILRILDEKGPSNKESLSLSARVKRAELDHVLLQLYALGTVDIETEGKSKICYLNQMGNNFLEIIQEKEQVG